MRRLLRYIRGYEKETVIAPLFKMLEACFELLVPVVMATIIDEGIKNADLPSVFGGNAGSWSCWPSSAWCAV